ncbi:hypothetical protein OB13_03065 [Pontibacter sp. HJ8]
MKKSIRFVVLFLCLAAAVQAQDDKLAGQRIRISIGSATPVGDFDKDRFEDDYPPFAQSGTALSISYAHELKPRIAVGATAGWRRNAFNLDKFAGEDDELVRSREATAWQTGFALADVYLQHGGRSFFGYLKGSLGGASSTSPRLEVETEFGPIRRSSDQATSLAYGLAYGLGVEAQRLALSIEIGSLSTKPTFEVRDVQGNSTRYKQAMRTIQLSFGVAYTL